MENGTTETLAVVAVLATAVGFLGWIIKAQFGVQKTQLGAQAKTIEQNNKAYERLAQVIERLEKSINDRDTEQLKILRKISEKQDAIYDTINATNMTVDNLYVMHDNINCREQKGGKHVATAKKS